jgi:hypothetical protein
LAISFHVDHTIIPVESLRYGQLSTIASDIARRNIGYTIQ